MFEFNAQQRRAIEHGRGPLLILAGPGTGKTGTLAGRIAHLIASGVDPGRICLLTFTRRASQEMLARAARVTGRATAGRVWGGTFHSVANRVLRLHGRRLGLDPAFTLLDRADASDLLALVRHDVLSGISVPSGISATGRRFPRPDTLGAIYSRVVSTEQRLDDVLARDFPWCTVEAASIAAMFGAYTARKRARHLVDFEDLLVAWRSLAGVPGGTDLLAGLWDHVLVDEYQDTNKLQADVLSLLRPDGQGLSVVGDDAQAIYAFRAATTRNIVEFPERFPGTMVVRLEHNYRSTSPILAVANAVMAAAPEGTTFEKALWSTRSGCRRPRLRICQDESVQAEAVCDAVLGHREMGVALHQQVVLFRASHHADVLELALIRRNIPFVKYGGLKLLEAAHVKDLMALLRVLDNPWDELAWFRTLQLLEGVGQATARRIMGALGLDSHWPAADPAATPLARLLAAPPRVPPSAVEELAGLRAALGDSADGSLPGGLTPPPGVQVERLGRWLDPVVERRYGSGSARMADLERLQAVAARYADRGRFVAELTLDPPASTGDLAGPPLLDEDWLVLSTVHSAKGGEWDVVHVLHAADGMFPSDLACGDSEGIEEERRLMYVALTRARDVLEVTVPLRRHFQRGNGRLSDAHSYAQVSRFLTPEVRSLMDTDHVGGRFAAPGGSPADQTPAGHAMEHVDRFLAGLWDPTGPDPREAPGPSGQPHRR